MRPEHVGVVRVEDGGLDRCAEQRLGVVDQVGVERVVAGDQHAEGVLAAAPGPADLLPQRRAGAREAGHQHGVEPGDVDAELEGVGGGQPEQPPAAQRLLERAALLGQVAAAVGRDPVRAARASTSAEQPPRGRARPARRRAGTGRRPASARRSTTRSASRSAVSEVAARRTGAPFSPA